MNFTEWYLNNPRLVVMTMVLTIASGIMALITLPRIEDPILTPRFGAITTVFAGATVERIESLISRKIEEELSDLAEIKEVFSFSRPGVSLVIIELRDEFVNRMSPMPGPKSVNVWTLPISRCQPHH